jgi:RNA polymerase sigma-70 factor (ECF subfamily)
MCGSVQEPSPSASNAPDSKPTDEVARGQVSAAVDDVDLERDRDLVFRAQSGDEDAFAALYCRYYRRLVRFAIKRVGDPAESEEIAQEAFARAYRALPGFAGERRFYPWLTVITSRLCIDCVRRRCRIDLGDVDDKAVVEIGFERLEKEDEAAVVTAAMGRLSPRHRQVLELRERQGLSYQDIAEHFDVSIGTVEALLWRARRALRREYGELTAVVLALPLVRRIASAQWSATAPAWSAAVGTAAILGMAAAGPVAAPPAAAAAAPAPIVRVLFPTPVATPGVVTVASAPAVAVPVTGGIAASTAPAPVVPDSPPPAVAIQGKAPRAVPALAEVYQTPAQAQAQVDQQPVHIDLGPLSLGADPAAVQQDVRSLIPNVAKEVQP